jgi:hypothetical protein
LNQNQVSGLAGFVLDVTPEPGEARRAVCATHTNRLS